MQMAALVQPEIVDIGIGISDYVQTAADRYHLSNATASICYKTAKSCKACLSSMFLLDHCTAFHY